MLKRLCASFIACVACLMWNGCSQRAQVEQLPSVVGVAPVPKAAPRSERADRVPSLAVEPPKPPSQTLVSDQPSSKKTTAQRAAAEIVGRYAIFQPSPDVLIVRRTDINAKAPSLFEESIALASIRSRLKSTGDLPPAVSQRSRLSNGTAIIPFDSGTAPDKAADAITLVLAINGVQSVRAVFADPS